MIEKMAYYATRLSQVLLSNLRLKSSSKEIVFYPPFSEEKELADQYNRIRWYIPQVDDVKIYLPVSNRLMNINIDRLPVPKYLRKPVKNTPNVILLSEESVKKRISTARVICVEDGWQLFPKKNVAFYT